MDMKKQLEYLRSILTIKECMTDYVGPILVFGNSDMIFSGLNPTVISAKMPKEEFVIINNRIPKWVNDVRKKAQDVSNVLVIKDFDKISVIDQEIFLDILEDNQISTEELPDNLKIVLTSYKKCDINLKIRDIVECYNLD